MVSKQVARGMGWVRDTEVTGIPHGVRSEALECVQLAAAFACASLLAAGLFPRASRP